MLNGKTMLILLIVVLIKKIYLDQIIFFLEPFTNKEKLN